MKEKNGEHPFGDSGQLILFIVFILVWIMDSFVLNLTDFLTREIPLFIRIIISAVILILSLVLINAGHKVIDHGEKSKELVSTGAFRFVRHPLYLGSMLFYSALVIITLSILSAGLLIIIFVFYNYIADYEEKILAQNFGEGYLNYKKLTGKWVPKIL